jgi:plasmid maintenance system antidote protein VapI
MRKDKRYGNLKKLFAGSHINSFEDFFSEVPKTTLTRDLGMHHQTFNKLLEEPEGFTYKITIRIASLVGVEDMEITKLIYKEIAAKRTKGKKKKAEISITIERKD